MEIAKMSHLSFEETVQIIRSSPLEDLEIIKELCDIRLVHESDEHEKIRISGLKKHIEKRIKDFKNGRIEEYI
jgi:hypothetical protein